VAGPKGIHDKLWQDSMPCISDCVIAIGSSINNEILELRKSEAPLKWNRWAEPTHWEFDCHNTNQ